MYKGPNLGPSNFTTNSTKKTHFSQRNNKTRNMGGIFSAIANGISAVISAIANIVITIVEAVAGVNSLISYFRLDTDAHLRSLCQSGTACSTSSAADAAAAGEEEQVEEERTKKCWVIEDR
jgi:hypothetical protein